MTPEEVVAFSQANSNDFGMTEEEIKRRQKLVEAVAKYDVALAQTIASGPYRMNPATGSGTAMTAGEAWRRGPVTRGDTGGVSLSDHLRSTGQGVAGIGPPAQPAYNPLSSAPPPRQAPAVQGPPTQAQAQQQGLPSMSGPVPASSNRVSGTIPSEYNYPQGVPGGNNAWSGTTNNGQPMAGPRDQWGFVQPQQQTFMPSIGNGNLTQPSDYNYPQDVPGGNNAWFGTTNNGQPMAGPRDQWGFSQPEGGQANKGRYSPRPESDPYGGEEWGIGNFLGNIIGNSLASAMGAPQPQNGQPMANLNGMRVSNWGAPSNPNNILPDWQQSLIGAPTQGPQPYQSPDIWRGAPPGFMGDARWRMMR